MTEFPVYIFEGSTWREARAKRSGRDRLRVYRFPEDLMEDVVLVNLDGQGGQVSARVERVWFEGGERRALLAFLDRASPERPSWTPDPETFDGRPAMSLFEDRPSTAPRPVPEVAPVPDAGSTQGKIDDVLDALDRVATRLAG